MNVATTDATDHERNPASMCEPQPFDLVEATYLRHSNQRIFRVPVRFEFTDLHRRCAPSAATYCCPAERLLPTVAQHLQPVPPDMVFRDSSEDALRPWHRHTHDSSGPVADGRVR